VVVGAWCGGVGVSARLVVERLVNSAGVRRSEATIQSDVRMLLLDPAFGLAEDDLDVQLETPAGQGKRIDVEVGCTVIEVKRSLESPTAVASATEQLAGYVSARATQMGQRYVGVLTDGRRWIAFHEVDGALREATRHEAAGADPSGVMEWLEGVLATKTAIAPTPEQIATRLGADSSSHALDYATLAALYADSRELPTVALKRELWAKLLRSALGTQFTDDDTLFLEHTLLVNSAEIIAHLVLGLDAARLPAATLLSGGQFASAGLHGVVDRDFFDWVLEVPGGEGFVTSLARRLSRFDWSAVEHDVLKVLYESVIPAATRKSLGEYYTPDWLANSVVAEVVTDPLHQRVLDPACGSGTFIFYAVRRFLDAADTAGVPLPTAMEQVSSQVVGIDLHPVAVALARVTYLLALGRARLTDPARGSLSVPIYLGDSLGWDQREDLMTTDHLVIPTEVGDQLLSGELRFPEHLLDNAAAFDDLVESLVDESERAAGKNVDRLSAGTIRRLALTEDDLPDLNANFARLKQLHEAERNHIWSYYIRNVSRPAWLSRLENRVDVLVGNPPWLSYRHMTKTMQRRFKLLATDRGFWHNETTATHQDLAGVFVARAVERYLKIGGRFGFVVPNPVVDRDYWGGFRGGQFDGAAVHFTTSWDLRRIRPHLFPRGSAVIFAERSAKAGRMPTQALIWSGRAPHHHAATDTTHLLRHDLGELTISSGDDERSPYSPRFSQGANLVPRLFFRVEPAPGDALGAPAGRAHVRSKRSAAEKKPWKHLPDMIGTVESEFLWPTILGEQLVPFRVLPEEEFVIPMTSKGAIFESDSPQIDAYPGLAGWTRRSEELWRAHADSKMTLAGQIDHMRKLSQQLPIPATRVVYAASGMHVSAAVITNANAIIEHAVYWATVSSPAEGHYLAGILNSPVLTVLARPLMSYGKDERHIDKHVWKLPIPTYDPSDPVHHEIATLAAQLAEEISALTFRSSNFTVIRRDLRAYIAASTAGQRLNALVAALLGAELPEIGPSPEDPQEQPPLIRTTTGPLPLTPVDVEIDIDCEFDAAGRVYLWGAFVTQDGSSTYWHVGSTEPDPDERVLAASFITWLTTLIDTATAAGKTAAVYHYGTTEPAQLRRLAPDHSPTLLARSIDLLHSVIRPNYYSPGGYSLKHLATVHGATWRTPGATGLDTLTWIEQARAGSQDSWIRLLRYNEDDARGTRHLRAVLLAEPATPT